MLATRIFKFPFVCELLSLEMAVAATPAIRIAIGSVQLPGRHLGSTLLQIICNRMGMSTVHFVCSEETLGSIITAVNFESWKTIAVEGST